MGEISESMLLLEERNNFFPWVAEVNKRFSKCFPSDYDDETLDFFHREIEKELEAISIRSPKKNEALFSTLLCFYNHFCWKTKWKKPSRMKSSCARILSSICRVGLRLSKGNVQSKWINQVLSAVSLFPGDCDYLYDALLQICKLNKKYYSAYAAVLRHILKDPQPRTENPCTFFKLLLLFRRLKFFLQNPYEKAQVDSQAASVAIPENLMSWLAENDLHDVSKAMKKNKMIIMKKKFGRVLLFRIREAVLRNTPMETSPILKDNEAIQFSIDCNPETVDEFLSNSLNMEDIVNSEVDLKITKSKRKSTAEHNESNEGSSTKKRKKKSFGNKLNKKRISIEQSPKEVIFESEISNEFIESNLDSNTLSNSNKKQKKNSKTKFDQVPPKEISKMSVDINLKEESKAPITTDVIDIESDSMCVQSYSSAIQSINKMKKKRNTINIVEEFNPKEIETEASSNENDLAHVQSIKKGKNKRKTINVVQDIENSSNQNESLNVRPANQEQKNRTSMNVVLKPQGIENELVVYEKTASSTKKGKKRKNLNIAQENILNDIASQTESETDVSLYVQSLETGKNRRKTITISQDLSQKYIKKDLLNVPSSKTGKKKRQTINTVEEINQKNIECQSKFNENYSLCTPPVTTESDSSSIPRSASKTNKKRRNSHFTSADFIVTSCENVDSVDKEYFNDDLNKRNSTSMKNEWIVTAINSDSGTIPLTPKTPPEKHNFKVSEMKKTISEVVSVETNDNTKVEAIAVKNNGKNIATPVALTSASESESLDTDEEEKSGDTKIIKPIPKVVKFDEEIEYIVSANETETNNTEDDGSISETESVDTIEETPSSESTDGTKPTKTVKFVDETESIISSNEIEVTNTEDKEADESISETESVGTAEEAESSDETEAIIPISESAKFDDIASTNEVEAFESIIKLGESNILEEARIVETTESKEENVKVTESVEKVNEITRVALTDNATFSKPIADIGKVEDNESNDVGPSDKTKAFKSIPEPIDEKNVENTKSIDIVSEAVRVVEETKNIDSTIPTEDFESIPETEDKTVENVETDKDTGTINIIKETEDINFFNGTENLDSISEIGEGSLNKIPTVKEVKLVHIVEETETIDFIDETKDFKPIPETEKEIMEDVNIVEDADAANTIEETENLDSFKKSQDFDPIPETNEMIEETKDIDSTNKTDSFESVPETVKSKDIVVDPEAIEIVEETKEISTTETDVFESVPETEEETVKDIVDLDAIESVEETKDVVSTTETNVFESVPETEEETVKDKDIVVDSEAIEIIEESKDISTTETDVFESVPEAEEETVKDKDIIVDSEAIEIVEVFKKPDGFETIPQTEDESVKGIEGSEAIEIVEETKDIDCTTTVEEFEPISETKEESVKDVENVEGSEAVEIIEETKDIDFTNKTDGFESVPETEEETVKDKDIILDWEEFEIIEETGDIDSTNKIEEFEHVPETEKESIQNVEGSEATEIVDETDALDAVVTKETTCSTLGETTTVSIEEIKTVENMETDVKSSDKTETLELRKDINIVEFTERDFTDIKTEAVKDVQETNAKPVEKTKVRDSIEVSDKTETEDSDEILEIIDSTDKTETEDTDEYLEILDSTDDKTETEETDEQIENFESTNEIKVESVDKSGDMEYKVEAEDVAESENVPSSTQYSTKISESELDTSITQYNSLVKEIFCDAGSDDSVLRESLSPCKIETIKKDSIELVSSKSVMSPKSSAEILENKPSIIKNCEVSSLNSETDLNSSENIADESSEIEQAETIINTQYYCKLLLKDVTEDNFIEDSDNETVDESKNIDLELSKNIPNQSSSEETVLDSQAQFEGNSSTQKDISFSKIVVGAISNDEKVDSKETETVESIAEGLYKKVLKAKKERLSLTNSVPEKAAAAILTENTVSYVIEKVIKKVEDADNTDNVESIGDLKKHIKFASERSQLPKLGNLSNLKPFGFPEEKSECLSFVDFTNEKVSESTEIESSDSCPQAKRKDFFYPYRNLHAIEVPDDKSESNFSDVLVDDKLEETICVPNEEDSSDEETEIDEEISCSPVIDSSQNETIVKEPKTDDEIQSSVLKTQNSPKLDSEELRSLVCSMKDPVVNLGRKCDDVRFASELSQHDNDVASSYEKNEILSTETKNQIEVEGIVESQASLSGSQESKSQPEKVSENEEIIPTRRLRNRNLSLSEVTNKSTSAEENQNSQKSSRTKSSRKPSNLKTSTESNSEATSTSLRRSTRKLRMELQELQLDSPKRCNPANEDSIQNIESDSNGKPTKSRKLATRSMASKRNDSAVSKTESECSDPSVEVEDGGTTLPKETSKNSFARKRATRSTATATKITKYFFVQTKAELTPVNETESEDQVEDSAESSTENLPVKKRFTRSNVFAIDKWKSEPFDAKEDVKDTNLGDKKSKNTVPKRSTRITTRGASRTKLSQNTPAKEESDVEDMDTQSNVSEESHKENVANEESASKEVESSSKEYNLRRSTRNLIRPSRLKLSQDHF